MSSFGMCNDIIQCFKSLYISSKRSVLLNNNIGKKFNTIVVVRQGCLLSPVMFNIFLENNAGLSNKPTI